MKTRTKTRTIPKTPFFAAFSVGAVLFSAHAGGGFATGNQANTYYVGLGWAGIVSAIVAMLLLTLTMREAMIMYNSRGLTSYKQLFETLYHPFDKIEWLFEIFFYIMVLMAVAAVAALLDVISVNRKAARPQPPSSQTNCCWFLSLVPWAALLVRKLRKIWVGRLTSTLGCGSARPWETALSAPASLSR